MSSTAGSKPLESFPVIPLPYATVLLPGVALQIKITSRHDIAALLKTLSSDAAATMPAVVCVPLRPPPKMSDDDKKRLVHEEGDEVEDVAPHMLNIDPSSATTDELFSHGTVARIVGVEGYSTSNGFGALQTSDGGLALVVEGVTRCRLAEYTQRTPFFVASCETFPDEPVANTDKDTLEVFGQLKSASRELIQLLRVDNVRGLGLSPMTARRLELSIAKKDANEAGALADFMVSAVDASLGERLEFLMAADVPNRLHLAVSIITRQVAIVKAAKRKLGNATSAQIVVMDPRKGAGLPQWAARRKSGSKIAGLGPLGGEAESDGEHDDELEELAKRIKEARLPAEAAKVAKREMARLKRMSPVQAEYGVCRTYLETLSEIPWSKTTEETLDHSTLSRARSQLDKDHYGLEKIKKRLLEYLAVLRLKQQQRRELEGKQNANAGHQPPAESDSKALVLVRDVQSQGLPKTDEKNVDVPMQDTPGPVVDKSPILLLVGPPGVGKTSLAKSVATALGRKFHRISLGGVRDEAEIRGHRRTYVAAMPGVIVNGLKKVGVANPVILLDEIDKVGGSSPRGDPSAAMLEVLDPEQNWSFTDHYINLPIDLSKVLFIATANSIDTIPPPLLDRMEMIQLSGYTALEKKHIASQYLIPKQLQANALGTQDVQLPEDVIEKIIISYTRESGVRNLEREIGSVCRAKAVEFSEAKDAAKLSDYKQKVEVKDLEEILGIEKFYSEITERSNKPGVVTGLVAYSIGGTGSILFIESSFMPGTGRMQYTGTLGDVIKESVEVALTWVRAHAYVLGLTNQPDEDLMKNKNVHVHCPAGAVPKDGPSAGIAFTVGLISLFSDRPVRPTLAMTGEVSLRGKVTAVGGIKEKLIGALSAGVRTVLLPQHNRKDVKDLPLEVKTGLEIIYIRNVWEALKYVWPEWTVGDDNIMSMESRL